MSHSHFCFSIPDVIKNDRLKLVAFDVINLSVAFTYLLIST